MAARVQNWPLEGRIGWFGRAHTQNRPRRGVPAMGSCPIAQGTTPLPLGVIKQSPGLFWASNGAPPPLVKQQQGRGGTPASPVSRSQRKRAGSPDTGAGGLTWTSSAFAPPSLSPCHRRIQQWLDDCQNAPRLAPPVGSCVMRGGLRLQGGHSLDRSPGRTARSLLWKRGEWNLKVTGCFKSGSGK